MTDKPDIPGTYGAGSAPAGVSVTVRTYAVPDGRTSLLSRQVRSDRDGRGRLDRGEAHRGAQVLRGGPLAGLLGRVRPQNRLVGSLARLLALARRGQHPGADHRG